MLIRKRKNQGKRWPVFSRHVFLVILLQCSFVIGVFSQNITVSGTVTEAETGELLPGVNVIVVGTTQGSITSVDGEYQISVPSDVVLRFSYIGYKMQEIPVNGRTEINVALEKESTLMDEIVVVGYGTARRQDLTGSIASISSDEISKIPIANAAEALKGRLPGVNIITTDGSPDAEVVIRVRGGGSVTQ
nr:carboxypeptidase-like regulatory domain-containing protein [Bacteroidales bacterium]